MEDAPVADGRPPVARWKQARLRRQLLALAAGMRLIRRKPSFCSSPARFRRRQQ